MSSESSSSSSFQTVNGGVSLFLLTFIILCLVSFAALSIVSARADARLTEKYRQQTEYYYGARNEAQKYLQELDGGSTSAGTGAEFDVGVGAGAGAAGADGVITKRFSAGPHMDLVLTVQTAGGQNASAAASAAGPDSSAAASAAGPDSSAAASAAGPDSRNYRVICEKTESTVTYNYDSTLPVMKR